jgi:uncharacterized protein (TIGR00299 family) protein
MQIHLDPLGGIAGDMFIAALLDAFPAEAPGVVGAIGAVAPGLPVELRPHRDSVLAGARFLVPAADAGGQDHVAWAAIRARLEAAPLPPVVRRHAIGIFAMLAEAEGRVHGIPAEAVVFHEVGALDSIADVVGAAQLIAALDAERWTVAPLPLGGGRVESAHGPLPVPTPAVALLLEGFLTWDDGVAGERVTPTGAAILRHLGAAAAPPRAARRLLSSGIGFGSRALPGLSNCLRALAFAAQPAPAAHRELAVLEFEVDDQSPEDLAIGLERLRAVPGVLDVLQMPAFGKKGRMMTHIQILASPAALEPAIAACFEETTTIGLRYRLVEGAALERRIDRVEIDGRPIRVKSVARPGGRTAKADADDVADAAGGQRGRVRLRRAAERRSLGDGAEEPR